MCKHAKPLEESKCTNLVTSTHALWQPSGRNGAYGAPAHQLVVVVSRGGKGATLKAGMGHELSPRESSLRKRNVEQMHVEFKQLGHGASGDPVTPNATTLTATVGQGYVKTPAKRANQSTKPSTVLTLQGALNNGTPPALA